MSRPYRILGLSLIVAGALLAPISYFVINSAPLTATAISAAVIGFTCFGLANTRPYLSPEASQMILETGMENIAGLLEELSLKSKAIYLPAKMRENRSQAIIPLTEEPVQGISSAVTGRLIVRYGSAPQDVAIAVATPGSVNLKLLQEPVGPEPNQIEAAISYLLVGVLDLATSVSVTAGDRRLNVDITNPRLKWENVWFYRSLGSPIASIAAAVACEGTRKPVRVINETLNKNKARVELEVLG
jgi:hypothetical protein